MPSGFCSALSNLSKYLLRPAIYRLFASAARISQMQPTTAYVDFLEYRETKSGIYQVHVQQLLLCAAQMPQKVHWRRNVLSPRFCPSNVSNGTHPVHVVLWSIVRSKNVSTVGICPAASAPLCHISQKVQKRVMIFCLLVCAAQMPQMTQSYEICFVPRWKSEIATPQTNASSLFCGSKSTVTAADVLSTPFCSSDTPADSTIWDLHCSVLEDQNMTPAWIIFGSFGSSLFYYLYKNAKTMRWCSVSLSLPLKDLKRF